MKLVSLKDPKLVELTGLQVEFTTVDNAVHSVRLTDPKSGRAFVIDKGESYSRSINVYEVQTHEDREQWKVTFQVAGRDNVQMFDDEDLAQTFVGGFRNTDIETKIEKVVTRVPVGAASVKPVDTDDDLPF